MKETAVDEYREETNKEQWKFRRELVVAMDDKERISSKETKDYIKSITLKCQTSQKATNYVQQFTTGDIRP